MSREVKTIKLSACEVDIIKVLNWGENEDIQGIAQKGAKLVGLKPEQIANNKNLEGVELEFNPSAMADAKYKLLEIAVQEIREGEIKKSYSKDWVRGLSIEDGELLWTEANKLMPVKNL